MLTQEQREKLTKAGYSEQKIRAYEMVKSSSQPNQEQGSISKQFQGGIDQFKQGYSQAQGATNPLQSLGAGMKELAGGVTAATSFAAPVTQYLGKGIDYAADKISDSPAVQRFAQTPLGEKTASLADFLADTSEVVGAVGGLKGAPNAGGAVGALAKAPKSLATGAGKALKGAGEGAYSLTIAPEKSTAKALLNYDSKQPTLMERVKNLGKSEPVGEKPVTEANTAARQGLVGTEYQLGVKAKRIANELWDKTIKPKLDGVKATTNMKAFLSEIEKEVKSSESDLTRRGALLDALNVIKNDYKNVSNVTLSKLQDYKSAWAKFIPDASYSGKPIASTIKEIHDLMAKKARQVIYKNVGEEGKKAYIDWGNLQSIIESAEKSIQGDPAAKSLGRDVWQFVMNKAITPVATMGGQVLYKTGEGLEFLGKKGAKTVEEAIK